MATRHQQTKLILEWASGGIHGHDLRKLILKQGWNTWQVSMVVGQAVRDGVLHESGPFAGRPGNVYKKTYQTSPSGVVWNDTAPDPALDRAQSDTLVDLIEYMQRASVSGKAVIIPGDVTARQARLLRDAGFEVGRWIRVNSEAKALRTGGS